MEIIIFWIIFWVMMYWIFLEQDHWIYIHLCFFTIYLCVSTIYSLMLFFVSDNIIGIQRTYLDWSNHLSKYNSLTYISHWIVSALSIYFQRNIFIKNIHSQTLDSNWSWKSEHEYLCKKHRGRGKLKSTYLRKYTPTDPVRWSVYAVGAGEHKELCWMDLWTLAQLQSAGVD